MRKAKGFTLAELLVVVAILAILVAVSIPIFSGKIKETEETVCLANQTSLRHALVIRIIEDDSYDNKIIYNYYNSIKEQFKCPSKDGKISFTIIGENVQISCNKHGSVTPAAILELALNELFNSELSGKKLTIDPGSSIDSTAPNKNSTPKANLIKKYLSTSDFNDLNVATWSIINHKQEYTYMWSTYSISSASIGDMVPTIGYNSKTKKYTVARSEVTQGDTSEYQIISQVAQDHGFENTTGAKSFDTLAEAQAEYGRLAED